MQTCPHCSQRVLDGLDHCPHCRAAINAYDPTALGVCTTCGTPIAINALFCPGCGRQLLVDDAKPTPIPFAKERDVRCPYCNALLRREGLDICPYCAKRLRPPSTRRPGFRRVRPQESRGAVPNRFCMYCGGEFSPPDGEAPHSPRYCPHCGRDVDRLQSIGGREDPVIPRAPPSPFPAKAGTGYCQNCGQTLPHRLDRWPTGEPRICAGCGYHLGGASRNGHVLSAGSGHLQRKDQTIAAVLSLLVPGLGQVYNGRLGRGCLVFGGTAIGLLLLIIPGLCVWGFGVWDGYRMARDMNLGNLPYATTPKGKMAAFVVVPLLIVFLIVSQPPVKPIAPPDFTNALTVPYDDLFRYNEEYVNQTVLFRGKIEQISKNPFAEDEYVFRVSTKESQYFSYADDVIWVNYKGPRYLEGDVIEVCGVVRGLKEYTAIFWNSVTVPEVDAAKVAIIRKSGNS